MDKSKKRPPPFPIRLSDSQRKEIERRSSEVGLSIAGYIKFTALDQPPRKLRHPPVDRVAIAQLLGQLGRVGSNINQLTRMGHVQGEFSISELAIALNELIDMREAIMKALGYHHPSDDEEGGGLS
ncbi:plasmid mobilization protein [Porticoccus sp. GXU_MW_L64]